MKVMNKIPRINHANGRFRVFCPVSMSRPTHLLSREAQRCSRFSFFVIYEAYDVGAQIRGPPN